jgi:hypothetical protein
MQDLAWHISRGEHWHGHEIYEPLPVVVVALEGQGGLASRVAGYPVHYGQPWERVHYVDCDIFEIADATQVRELTESIAAQYPRCVVVIDTLACAMAGLDENSSRDMARAIEAAKFIQKKLNGLVLIVAHTGKDATKGLRGHSSLIAAVDAAIMVDSDKRRGWKLTKSKNGPADFCRIFDLAVVEISAGVEGRPADFGEPAIRKKAAVTGCVVVDCGYCRSDDFDRLIKEDFSAGEVARKVDIKKTYSSQQITDFLRAIEKYKTLAKKQVVDTAIADRYIESVGYKYRVTERFLAALEE